MSVETVQTAERSTPAMPGAVPVREGVYGERVAAVEPGGIEYIPQGERHGRPRQLFWTWSSPNFEFATVYVGVLPVVLFGGGFWLTALGLVVGTALGAGCHGVLSVLGPRYGVPQLVQSRAAFGWRGNLLPAAVNAITSGAGWVAVNSVSGAFAVQTLAQLLGAGAPPFWLALSIVVAIEIAIAFAGYNLVHVVQRVLFPLLAAIFAACCIVIFIQSSAGTSFNPSAPGAAGGVSGAFILAVFLAYAYAASWNPYAADYSRYLPESTPAWRVILNAGLGLFLSCAVLEIAGAALATVAGTSWGPNDVPTTQFVHPLPIALGILATAAIALGAIAANILNLYSASLSFLCLGVRIPSRHRRALVASIAGIVGFVVALTGSASPGGKYESFLFFNTYWIVAFVTILLVDWAMQRRYDEGVFFDQRRHSAAGLIALLGGVAASIPFWNQALFVGIIANDWPQTGDLSFVVIPMVSGTVYWLLRRRRVALLGRARTQTAS